MQQRKGAIAAALVVVLLLVAGLAIGGYEFQQQGSISTTESSSSTISTTLPSSSSALPTSTTASSTSSTFTTKETSTSSSSSSQVQSSTTSSSTTTTSQTAIPKRPGVVVRSSGYFLSTTTDMMLLDNATFSGFVANLIRANVTYLFFNLPNMNTSGYVADNFSQESALISRFDSLKGNHTFEYFGWTGTQIDPTDVLGNFTDPSIVTDVNSIYQAGFQGILIDMEPVPNDSPQFLSMLQDLKQAMSQEPTKMLLAANSMKVAYGATFGQEWTWDPTYFRNVTKLVDFVIPMLFESGTTTQYAYEQYSKQQIQLCTQYSSAPVLYSIPDWYANSTWHHPYAENMTNAVITFSALIASGTKLPNMIGLGIYALNKTYVLGQGPPTHALETTSYDWAYFINNWTNTSYPMKIGTAYG